MYTSRERDANMKRYLIAFVLICTGCAGRNTLDSGLSTRYTPDSSKVSDIALELKFRREW